MQNREATQVSTDCSNCGMPTPDFPKWKVKAYFPAEDLRYFCSPKCYFLYEQKQEVADSVWVMDFYEVKEIDAKSSYYVTGSDVLGPMGKDLVPVATLEAAEEFAKDHGGKLPMLYQEINAEVLKGL